VQSALARQSTGFGPPGLAPGANKKPGNLIGIAGLFCPPRFGQTCRAKAGAATPRPGRAP